MSLRDCCTPRPSVFAADRRATVLSLDTFLKGEVDGRSFFEENYFTGGMLTLVDRAFRHLNGSGAGSSVFQLSQAMGGGKTHSMISVHPSLGKELCVLCWAVEEASIDDIPNALRNWEALAPEERWWLYTMTVATTGQAMKKGVGWRKALRAAIADNPFVKGEGMSPKARRELLGHSQLTLEI